MNQLIKKTETGIEIFLNMDTGKFFATIDDVKVEKPTLATMEKALKGVEKPVETVPIEVVTIHLAFDKVVKFRKPRGRYSDRMLPVNGIGQELANSWDDTRVPRVLTDAARDAIETIKAAHREEDIRHDAVDRELKKMFDAIWNTLEVVTPAHLIPKEKSDAE